MAKAPKLGLSIKYKLLTLLIVLPILTLLLYLALAMRLFESDKIAYVFDSSAAVSRTLASQTLAEIRGISASIKPIFRGYRETEGTFDQTAAAIFASEPSLKAVGVLKRSPGGTPSSVIELSKDGAHIETHALEPLVANACANQFALSSASSGQNETEALFTFVVCTDHVPVVAIVTIPTLLEAFGRRSAYTTQLVDESSRRLLSLPDDPSDNLDLTGLVSSLLASNLPEKTSEIRDGHKGATIVSAARVGSSGMFVVSTIDRGTALKAMDVLVWKSALFLVCLISIAILISVYSSNKLTSTLRELELATESVAEGHFDIQVKVRSKDEVGSLATRFNSMAGEVSRLMSENVQKARMEKELETARTVQETLFPAPHALLGPMRIAGFYEPASECGGDWWHHGKIGEKIFLWIGDVTGHGAPAALITSAAKSAATLIEEWPDITPASALSLLNKSVFQTSRGKLNMTFFLAAFDPRTRELTYCNASHNPPFLIPKTDQPISKKDFVPLDEANHPRLGESLETRFQETKITLSPGDHLLFYTDGIVELAGRDGAPWGERNFIKSVIQGLAGETDPDACMSRIVSAARGFQGEAPLQDDLTFFLCRYEGEA